MPQFRHVSPWSPGFHVFLVCMGSIYSMKTTRANPGKKRKHHEKKWSRTVQASRGSRPQRQRTTVEICRARRTRTARTRTELPCRTRNRFQSHVFQGFHGFPTVMVVAALRFPWFPQLHSSHGFSQYFHDVWGFPWFTGFHIAWFQDVPRFGFDASSGACDGLWQDEQQPTPPHLSQRYGQDAAALRSDDSLSTSAGSEVGPGPHSKHQYNKI